MSSTVPTLLQIEASPRSARSHSRSIAADYVAAWRKAHPEGRVLVRDLGANPPPFVSEPWVVGAFTAPESHPAEAKSAIAVSDFYVDELFSADEVLIATPMYNLNVPAALKAWIDQIVRVGRTFAVGPNGYEGLVKGKKVRVIVASGGDFRPGTPGAGYDFLSPYLRGVLGFLGITDVEFIYAHSLSAESARPQSLAQAAEAARKLAAA